MRDEVCDKLACAKRPDESFSKLFERPVEKNQGKRGVHEQAAF